MPCFHSELQPTYEDLLEDRYGAPLTLAEFREFLFRRAGPRAAWKLDLVMAIRSWEQTWDSLEPADAYTGGGDGVQDAEFRFIDATVQRSEAISQPATSDSSEPRGASNDNNARPPSPGRAGRRLPLSVDTARNGGFSVVQSSTRTPLLPSPLRQSVYPMPLLSPVKMEPSRGLIFHGRPLPAFLHSPPGSPRPSILLITAARAIAFHFLFADSPMSLPFSIPANVVLPILAQIFESPELSLHRNSFLALRDFVEANLVHESNAGMSGFVRMLGEGNMVSVLSGGYNIFRFAERTPRAEEGERPKQARARRPPPKSAKVHPHQGGSEPESDPPEASKHEVGAGKGSYWRWFRPQIAVVVQLVLGVSAMAAVLLVKSFMNLGRGFLVLMFPAALLTIFAYLQMDHSFSAALYLANKRQRVLADRVVWRRIVQVALEEVTEPMLLSLQRHMFRRIVGFSVVGALVIMALFVPLWPDDITDPSKFILNIS